MRDYLNIDQSYEKKEIDPNTQDLNITSGITVIMRTTISIILGDMKSFNMNLHVAVLTVTTSSDKKYMKTRPARKSDMTEDRG